MHTWGTGDYGQLGLKNYKMVTYIPTRVEALSDNWVVKVYCGPRNTYFFINDDMKILRNYMTILNKKTEPLKKIIKAIPPYSMTTVNDIILRHYAHHLDCILYIDLTIGKAKIFTKKIHYVTLDKYSLFNDTYSVFKLITASFVIRNTGSESLTLDFDIPDMNKSYNGVFYTDNYKITVAGANNISTV